MDRIDRMEKRQALAIILFILFIPSMSKGRLSRQRLHIFEFPTPKRFILL
jgi:hypothetical protein